MNKNKLNDKQRALYALGYFDNLDKRQLETVCRLAVLRQYNPLETIYNEDKGLLTYVHFVVSGECMILQCLRMKVTSKKDKDKIFKLEIIKKGKDDLFYKIEKVNLLKITKKKIRSLHRKNNHIVTNDSVQFDSKSKHNFNIMGCKEREKDNEVIANDKASAILYPNDLIDQFRKEDEILDKEEEYNVKTSETPPSTREFDDFLDPDTKIENRFIDVGSLTFGGIFGLGELLEHRVIMARTTVQCILIPRFFLFEKENNPGGIWNRRRFYLECNIPSRQQLFENFLTTQKWQKFKNDLIERNLGHALKNNLTKVEDIPIMCRIVEANDD